MVNISTILTTGVVNMYTTEAKDNNVVVIVTNTAKYIIPMLKSGKECYAFIDVPSITTYSQLEQIISAIFDNEVYKGMYTYKPIKAAAPEHNKVITGFVAGKGGIKSNAADAALADAGYDISALTDGDVIKLSKRNYGMLIKSDPAAAEALEADKAMILAHNAKFEDTSKELQAAMVGVTSGLTNGILVPGPTGTGKSFLGHQCAVHMGAPALTFQVTAGTTVDDLQGTFIPDESGESKWKFVKGPLLKAYTEGWFLIIDEVNFGNPGVLAVINQYTDFNSSVTVNGTVYKKHPNFVAFMTMNPGYDGTEVLNVALKNRFAIVEVPQLSVAEYAQRMVNYSKMRGHMLPAEFFNKLYAFSGILEKESASNKWHENCKFSIRNAQRLVDVVLQKRCTLEDFKAAIAVNYLNNFSLDNDNSAKLADFKKSEALLHEIEAIYNEYNFREIKTIATTVDFDALFTEDEGEDDKLAKEKAKASKRAADMFGKFDL